MKILLEVIFLLGMLFGGFLSIFLFSEDDIASGFGFIGLTMFILVLLFFCT
tara:strand:+ start:460 stop:612 length:153 start_codon:yes stop_codon:yes gene_type:complete